MDLSSSPTVNVPGPSKGVNNLLRTLRGEHFRRGLNAQRVRVAHSAAQQERGPSLPPLRPAPGPPPPRSWMQQADELAMRESFAFKRDSPAWRTYALRLAYAHLAAPPPTPSLVGLCLQTILNEGSEVYLEILPELPVHLRRHLMLETAIADPLPFPLPW
ncbi:hypothetical protein EXIGLDRAFT_730264 [Exidia glandulosa HHB12029]|uniref:Uncharacterized protein n=1 Tax=Exidia glandulosa HHB12029 TaxID=1314781 RepID=A0A165LAB0_EXIGL|nr:hypothetical protein EXIGLDRAFT_730264 [Exidia glandulosa HHB12029]